MQVYSRQSIEVIFKRRLKDIFERYVNGADSRLPIFWVAIQICHPITHEYFFIAHGSGYEDNDNEDCGEDSDRQITGKFFKALYRKMRVRLFDEILFSKENRSLTQHGWYVVRKETGDGLGVDLNPGHGSIKYFAEPRIWLDGNTCQYPSTVGMLSTADYGILSGYFESAIGLSVGAAIGSSSDGHLCADDGVYANLPEKFRRGFELDCKCQANLSSYIDNERDGDLIIGGLLYPWKALVYDRVQTCCSGCESEGVDGGVSISFWDDVCDDAGFRGLIDRLVLELKVLAMDMLWYTSDVYRERLAIRSAIGSIMSRNGSHNIGSHVLAALSHNVGTMPEDRKLYQYIQHRMDYIATATTEFPAWKQPTMFVGTMLKAFLSQTHLLNYISRSEGLSAYQFQNPAVNVSNQENKIRLHVRRLDGEGHDFIAYFDDKNAGYDPSQDLAVAIPGGVIGQHAFFTILENIIRNAAKHEWCKRDSQMERQNLDVYVDFCDIPEKGIVEVTVWNDQITNVLDKKAKDAQDEPKSVSAVVKSLNEKICTSFISQGTGALRLENWGLAEMRISAGFLNNAPIEKIGGVGDFAEKSTELISALVVKNDKGTDCLGFRFALSKPKELLIVLPADVKLKAKDLASINKTLDANGIAVMMEDQVLLSSGLPYSFVLVEDMNRFLTMDKAKWPKFPFRILSEKAVKAECQPNKDVTVFPQYDGAFFDYTNYRKDPRKELTRLKHDDEGASALLESIYQCWISHLVTERGEKCALSLPLMMSLDVAGNGEGARKSLISGVDLLHFVLSHSINSVMRSYLQNIRPENCELEFSSILICFILLQKKFKPVQCISDFESSSLEEVFRSHVEKWLNEALKDGDVAADNDVRVCDSDGAYIVPVGLQDKLKSVFEECSVGGLGYDNKDMLIKSLLDENNKESLSQNVSSLWNFVERVALEQARSFLSKYEERICTVPEDFGSTVHLKQNGKQEDGKEENKSDPDSSGRVYAWKLANNSDLLHVSLTRNATQMAKLSPQVICYWRHGDDESQKKDDESQKKTAQIPSENRFYLEPLSGSQSYMSALASLAKGIPLALDRAGGRCNRQSLDVRRELFRLVENALLRVTIIDERAKKFADDHSEVGAIFKTVGISVDDQFATIGGSNDEILIVHQGILDKALEKNLIKDSLAEYLLGLKRSHRYVVVTTGRGVPANIPAMTRVLPFSVVESALFRRYPEKMLLIDAVMNILPIGERKS